MKIKVGQKVRIGKSAKCIEALESFDLTKHDVKPALGRIAFVSEITTYNSMPAVHLNFPGKKSSFDIRDNSDYNTCWPVLALRKP